jgi:NADH-ubiquinone oxidoreductase chain 2
MITIAILILIVAKALPGLNTHIYSIHVTRITSIVFLFASALSFNCLNFESLGSSGGIGIFSGFYQITIINQIVEIFLFIIGGGILIAWPQFKYNNLFNLSSLFSTTTNMNTTTMISTATPFQQAPNLKKSPSAQAALNFFLKLKNKAQAIDSFRESLSLIFLKEKQKVNSNPDNKKGTDYSLIVLFSSLGSSLLISSYDLISIYLSIELQSFGLYVLSTLYKDKESSTSAGLKYFLLGGLSSCILLLGTGIIYSYTGTTSLESIYIINSVIDINLQYIIQGISLGLSLIFIGFLFKIAAAPLHNWSPDVYDGTPTIVTIWLTIIPKIAILFILLELQVKLGSFSLIGSLPLDFKTIFINNSGNLIYLPFQSLFAPLAPLAQAGELFSLDTSPLHSNPFYISASPASAGGLAPQGMLQPLGACAKGAYSSYGTAIFLISSFLSLIIGSLLGLAQKKIKRLLAYSTISHLGFILLALTINTEQSIDSFIFYIIQYTITNLNIFLIILGLTYYFYAQAPSVCAPPAFGGGALAPAFGGRMHSKGCYNIKNKKELEGKIGCTKKNIDLELELELEKDISFISELKGLFFKNPLLSFSLIVSLFSMAGIPPLIGFFSKQLVLYSALQNGYYFLSLVAIIVSVISCSYYLQIVKVLLTTPNVSTLPYYNSSNKFNNKPPAFGGGGLLAFYSYYYKNKNKKQEQLAPKKGNKFNIAIPALAPAFGRGEGKGTNNLTNTHSYLIAILTLTNLFFFIKPSLILNSTQLLSLSLFYI